MEETRMETTKGTVQLRLDTEGIVRLLIPARDGYGMAGTDLERTDVEELVDLLRTTLKYLK